MHYLSMEAPRSRKHSLVRTLALAMALVLAWCATCAQAGPWVGPGDQRIKHHLNVLTDAGHATLLTTSWPVMWSDIKSALDELDPRTLSAQALWSYQYLRHEIRAVQQETSTHHEIALSNTPLGIGNFGSPTREQSEVGMGIDWVGETLAINLSGQYAHNPTDGRDFRADGSYAAYLLGDWALGFGAIDRWWGPGWESSLILTNNARPIPGVFLQRQQNTPFSTPWLSWLGPWQLTSFMGELEKARHVPDARLWGIRFNFRPLQSLEIGASRTAMWGGRERPGDLNTFFDLLLGRDNLDDNAANEPGNQLAGFDARWSFTIDATHNAIYAQLIGEDEAGYLPSRHIGMGGIETSGLAFGSQYRLSLEAQNTTVYFYDKETVAVQTDSNINKPAFNSAYEHGIYQTGYRYLGRPIGASTDNDSETMTVRLQWYFSNGHHMQTSIAKNRINRDSTNKSGPGGNVFGANKITDTALAIEYNAPLSDVYSIQIGLFNHSTPLEFKNKEIGSGGYLKLEGRW